MVAMPTSESGDLLLADRTEALLLYPKVQQPPFAYQVLLHFDVEASLEVGFPGRVKRIRFPSDIGVPLDGHA
jgi:hypothetical protein